MSEKKLHLAIIPDGNRRWARAKGLHPWEGHARAVENFRTISDWCRAHEQITTLTIWCFSTENWKRDKKEISKLMSLLENYVKKNRNDMNKQQTRFLHSGRKDRIPASLAKSFTEIEKETKHNVKFNLHLALDYGGKDEILRAIERMKNNETLAQNDILRPYLDQPDLPDIDIIIRTSGEHRTSNFFLWQSTYAEWFFLEKHFPDFEITDIEQVLDEYVQRQRRFGG
ncbi:di-trans,poly-cis-decaprenylcistransferase [Candidatus Peregrinibacteria bacterium CG10_big_fil_rev_8_21_14_0_10_49_16]|nr:MAG: di-trans,poly-cis-decaprenylcistransferase [Candidatus Peregrinibacteria bacterium CG22_combo_CG10-13_8_21_14_all_49_11]PIR51960.1 MAG: di-trans,poly-cis-decaprenylcistransferase [Candidatus Peregrinibacteria bacterium CG10_big_fil_rev_8_21_14_0_10_49_16]